MKTSGDKSDDDGVDSVSTARWVEEREKWTDFKMMGMVGRRMLQEEGPMHMLSARMSGSVIVAVGR